MCNFGVISSGAGGSLPAESGDLTRECEISVSSQLLCTPLSYVNNESESLEDIIRQASPIRRPRRLLFNGWCCAEQPV